MRLTVAIRTEINAQETRNKYHEVCLEADAKFNKAVEEEIEKHLAKRNVKIPQHLILERYVKVTNEVELEDLKDAGWDDCHFNIANTHPITCEDYDIKVKCTKKIQKLFDVKSKLEDEREKFTCDLRRMLNLFTTDKKAVESFPELAEYFTESDKATSMALLPLADIKKMRQQLAPRAK